MTSLTRVKLLVAAAGVSVWGVGVRVADDRLRWAGVALLALAALLRLFRDDEARGRRRAPVGTDEDAHGSAEGYGGGSADDGPDGVAP